MSYATGCIGQGEQSECCCICGWYDSRRRKAVVISEHFNTMDILCSERRCSSAYRELVGAMSREWGWSPKYTVRIS